MIDQKQLGNVEYFKYFGGILTNDGRYTCEIKSRIAMAKAAFNKKKILYQQNGLKYEEETSKMLPSQAKRSQSSNWGRRLARNASRRPPVC